MSSLTVREKALVGGPWPFGRMIPFSYDLLMVDPPWPTTLRSERGEEKSFAKHYGAMPWSEIEALPVGELAAENSVLWLWATWPLLFDGGDPKRHFTGADASRSRVGAVIRKWGFRYVTGGAWLKRTTHGKVSFGTGYRLRSACEPFLIGINGRPKTTRSERNFLEGLARGHSVKPDEGYRFCERWLPNGRYAEIFSRTSRPGWDTWGFEAGKFDPVVELNAAPLQEAAE